MADTAHQSRANVLPTGTMPGALTREAAAAWFMVSPTTFDRMVRDGLAPKPFRIFGCVRWRLSALAAALADLDKDADAETPWERQRA
jgi:hypothetical protein